MRLKQLRGLPVIDPTTARRVGSVVDYQIDPGLGRLAALDLGSLETGEGQGQRIEARRIRRVGRHAVILNGTGGANPDPAPSVVDERWLDTATLVGLEVLSDDGNRVGHLLDAAFDPDSLSIGFYVLRVGILERLVGFIGRRNRILPTRILSCSRELMLLSSGALKDVPRALAEDGAAGLPVGLKTDDRLPSPSFVEVTDGQAAAVQTR